MSSPPVLPPKTRSSTIDVPISPSTSVPIISSHDREQRQSSSLPTEARSPAIFINPLYFETSPTTEKTRKNQQKDSFKSQQHLSQLKEASTSSWYNSFSSKRQNSDTDSIYFLEKNNPSLTKIERLTRRRSSETNLTTKKMDHVYEICEIKEESCSPRILGENVSDIFDLVSFESPLGEINNNLETGTYDIPSLLPPKYPPPPLPPLSRPPSSLSVSLMHIKPTKEEKPRIPPRVKPPPPIPKRTNASLHSFEDSKTTQCLVYEPGPSKSENSIELREKKRENVSAKVKTSRVTAVESGVQLCGYLYKMQPTVKAPELVNKSWISLEGSRLCCYQDSKASSPILNIPVQFIVGVTILRHSKSNSQNEGKMFDLWCFQIFIRNGAHWYLGAIQPGERFDWLVQLTLVISPPSIGRAFFSSLKRINCGGEVLIKEGISGTWQRGFILSYRRILNIIVAADQQTSPTTINLQHVSAVGKESNRLSCATVIEPGLVFHLNLPQQVLYLQGDWPSYTNNLFEIIQENWLLPPNAGLAEQYLTTENVPLIIDKCLKFISTHGTTIEGIYRHSGSNTKVQQLLNSFAKDVWGVHLKLTDYSPHDVTCTLKRYLRSLPECILTDDQYHLWAQSSTVECKKERLDIILELLSHLPDINYWTLKKIIGHLCIISEHSVQNLMPLLNLSPVFGPSLFYKCQTSSFSEQVVDEQQQQLYNASTVATDILSDLVTNYTQLFKVQPQELEKERRFLQEVQKVKDALNFQKSSGDILFGVYIYSREWGKCINIKLTPTTTAQDVCEYAISIGNVREPISKISLMEVVCDGELERPFHFEEKVLPSALRWLTWSQEEAKVNYLCIRHNSIYDTVLPIVELHKGRALSVFCEINFAEASSKSFKKLNLEFTRASLKIYKISKNTRTNVCEWNIEDIIWYLGTDSKRITPTKWAFSFMDKKTSFKRSRSVPYFGYTVCCKTEEELHKIIAAMLIGENPQGLLPSLHLPDLLS